MYPGKMNLPAQSTVRPPNFITILAAIFVMRPLSTKTVALRVIFPSAGFLTVPPMSAMCSARAASAKTDNAKANAILSFMQTWQNTNEPVISVALTSTLPFYYSCCFAIDRSVIGFARSQIKFVGGNLEKRGSRHGKNHPEKPEHRPGGKCEE